MRRGLSNGATRVCAAVSLALALALAACAPDASAPSVVRADRLTLEARVLPAALRVGENQLLLALHDASGRPVPGAHVEAAVRMHAMGAMGAMGGTATVTDLGDGRYQADFALDMGGTWQVKIAAHAPGGETLRAEGSLAVGTEGVRLAIAGAGASANSDAPASANAPAAAPNESSPAAFSFPAERLQKIGVRTARAELRPLARTVRATARVAFDESALVDVSPKVSGWIESLAVAAPGDPVTRGQTLFTLYSPELYAAQLEYQQALQSRDRAAASARAERADALLRAAARRLALLGIAPAEIAALAKRSEPFEALPIRAPASGVVIEKNAVLGGAVNAGERLLRIAPTDRVWLEASLAEGDLALVSQGMSVRITLAGGDGETLAGRVVRIAPQFAAETRTATARIALETAPVASGSTGAPSVPQAKRVALRPGSWASVELDAAAGEGVVVPSSAVLRSGERSFVFLALGAGRFEPREVLLGFEMADAIEIRGGLSAGEEIVSAGTYLIASESRLRAAISQW